MPPLSEHKTCWGRLSCLGKLIARPGAARSGRRDAVRLIQLFLREDERRSRKLEEQLEEFQQGPALKRRWLPRSAFIHPAFDHANTVQPHADHPTCWTLWKPSPCLCS